MDYRPKERSVGGGVLWSVAAGGRYVLLQSYGNLWRQLRQLLHVFIWIIFLVTIGGSEVGIPHLFEVRWMPFVWYHRLTVKTLDRCAIPSSRVAIILFWIFWTFCRYRKKFLIRSDIGRVATTRTIPTDNLCSRLKTNWLAVLAIEDLLSFFILSTSFKRIASPMLVHDFRLIPIWFLSPYIIETLKWRALSPPWVQWKNQLSGTAWVRAWGNCVFPNTCFSSVTWVKDNCVSCHFGEIIFNYISVLLA